MDNIKNTRLVDLVNEILDDSGDSIPENLRQPLMDSLAESTLICPTRDDEMIYLQLGPNTFLPASCDLEDFRRIFKSEIPKVFEFKELSGYLESDTDGIILNPGSFGFVIRSSLAGMIFQRFGLSLKKGYDVKVRLDDFRPLHWRDLIIPAGITFGDLDDILKILWDFSGYHLSRFTFKDSLGAITNYVEGIGLDMGELDSEDVIIDEYFEANRKIYWEYDYGDGWSFTIEVKKAVDYDRDYPTVKRFKGEYNLMDDIGGVWGLNDMIEMDSDELTKFDIDDAQSALKDFRNNIF